MRSGGTSASGFAAAPLDFFRPMTLERMARARGCGDGGGVPGDGTRDAGRRRGDGSTGWDARRSRIGWKDAWYEEMSTR